MHQKLVELIIQFEWNHGNLHKSWKKHDVSCEEAEQLFTNSPLIIADDAGHSKTEKRFLALGKTDGDRKLLVAFTLRKHSVRIISTRPMNKRERDIYDKEEARTVTD